MGKFPIAEWLSQVGKLVMLALSVLAVRLLFPIAHCSEPSAMIYVNVDAERYGDLLTSEIIKQARQIPGISIGPKGSGYAIEIVSVSLKYSGVEAIAATFSKYITTGEVGWICENSCGNRAREFLTGLKLPLGKVVMTGSSSDIPALAKRLVAWMHVQYIEPALSAH